MVISLNQQFPSFLRLGLLLLCCDSLDGHMPWPAPSLHSLSSTSLPKCFLSLFPSKITSTAVSPGVEGLTFPLQNPVLGFHLCLSLPDRLFAPAVPPTSSLSSRCHCPPCGALLLCLVCHLASLRGIASLFPCSWLPPAARRKLCWWGWCKLLCIF